MELLGSDRVGKGRRYHVPVSRRYIGHFGCIIVGEGVVMGSNCNLSQGVTLGVAGRGDRKGSPTIGDRVFIAPGAKVIGKISIGNDVTIGANAVVSKSLPDRAVAVGIPAKVVP